MVVDEGTLLTVPVQVTDPDGDQTSLALGRLSASFSPLPSLIATVFAWTPDESQGPGTYVFTLTASDNQNPPATTQQTLTVIVNEVNRPPTLTLPVLPPTAAIGRLWSFTASATDPDIPANTLTFSLTGVVPAGASGHSGRTVHLGAHAGAGRVAHDHRSSNRRWRPV